MLVFIVGPLISIMLNNVKIIFYKKIKLNKSAVKINETNY